MLRSLARASAARRQFSLTLLARSAYVAAPRKTVGDIRLRYENNQPISVVTAWDYLSGSITNASDVDITLVGDSLAMVALGYPDTNEIGVEEMLYHVRAVTRGNHRSLIVADLPFGSYETSTEQAVGTAIRFVKEGRAQAIKLEGGVDVASKVAAIVDAGVPVLGHIGLTPQKHHTMGGFKLQGNSVSRGKAILHDCMALEEAGAFAVVLECIPNRLAELITSHVSIPTIGIGAGPHTSGQVLVMADLLQMNDPLRSRAAKFVKLYMDFFSQAQAAISAYKDDVSARTFPNPDTHGYKMKLDVLKELKEYANTLPKK